MNGPSDVPFRGQIAAVDRTARRPGDLCRYYYERLAAQRITA